MTDIKNNIESNATKKTSITEFSGELSLDDFAYELPHELIAKEPAAKRSTSRLMLLNRQKQSTSHSQFTSIVDYLKPGDLLVLNDTKVIPARINARRASGGAVEILLLKAEAEKPGLWQAMATPLRKLKENDVLEVECHDGSKFNIRVAGFSQTADTSERRLLVDLQSQEQVYSLLSKIGQAPLPPYILKERALSNHDLKHEFPDDLERYQTVYASAPGAVAAPTAGLHFTIELLEEIKSKGVNIAFITLHVGPGTFKPITTSLEDHSIESERFYIPEETAKAVNECKSSGGRVIAVGTTSCRALESKGAGGVLETCQEEESRLYIKPGFRFAITDALITNFHLSRSSLLVLVSAFAGHKLIMSAYKEAVEKRYRFYSYGDAMFIS